MNRADTDAWGVDDQDFPHDGSIAERLRFLLRYAILAPSGHNTQPWRFRVTDTSVEVYADRDRRLPVTDPDDRELTLSCGAATYLLRLAMRRFGLLPVTTLTPEPEGDRLAVVAVGGACEPNEDDLRLFGAVPYRHTARETYEEIPVPADLLDLMERDAAGEGAWLHRVNDVTEREPIAALVAEGDRRQFADPAFREELSRWVRADFGTEPDGIPGGALGLPGVASHLTPLLMRYGMPAAAVAGADERSARTSPALLVLGTPTDGRLDRLRAGQALARVLLRAAADGISASFLNQPVQVPELRERLRGVLGARGFPQMVLRLGYEFEGRPPHYAPRRPVEDVLL